MVTMLLYTLLCLLPADDQEIDIKSVKEKIKAENVARAKEVYRQRERMHSLVAGRLVENVRKLRAPDPLHSDKWPEVKIETELRVHSRGGNEFLGYRGRSWYKPNPETDSRYVIGKFVASIDAGGQPRCMQGFSVARRFTKQEGEWVEAASGFTGAASLPQGREGEFITFVVAYPIAGAEYRILAVDRQKVTAETWSKARDKANPK